MTKISTEPACMKSNVSITKDELHRIEKFSSQDFIRQKELEIESLILFAARNQQRMCEVPYHPLLDSYFSDLVEGGLKIESRTLDKITLSWST